MFSEKGQPAASAWRLGLVMVMQYAEGPTDRQAANAVKTRIDQIEIIEPVLPGTSWVSQEAGRFDHSHFLIDWETKSALYPAG